MFYVYMLASARNGTLYVGHTDALIERVRKHREKTIDGFTAKYGVSRLVWFEVHSERPSAFRRERQIKTWYRAWKLRAIEAGNPEWRDLYNDLIGAGLEPHPDLVSFETSLGPRIRGDERETGERRTDSAHPRVCGDPDFLQTASGRETS